jgi:hypothetical protein
LEALSTNPIGVITTLLKKGLIENPSNDVVSVIKRRNGCGPTVDKWLLLCLPGFL